MPGTAISGEKAGTPGTGVFTFFLPGITIARTIPITTRTPPAILRISGSEKASILP